MQIDEQIKEKREEILRIAASHGARNVRIFGPWKGLTSLRDALIHQYEGVIL